MNENRKIKEKKILKLSKVKFYFNPDIDANSDRL